MILIRLLLIFLIVYLLLRGFVRSLFTEAPPTSDRFNIPPQPKPGTKKVSKKIGEYVEYEEMKQKESRKSDR
jgi:hypothetical protein